MEEEEKRKKRSQQYVQKYEQRMAVVRRRFCQHLRGSPRTCSVIGAGSLKCAPIL
jgi:hypothetical protein